MSRFNVYLDTNIIRLYAQGSYHTSDYQTVNVNFSAVFSDNNAVEEEILSDFQYLVEKSIIEYVNDLEFSGNLNGDINNFIINQDLLDTFFMKINHYVSSKE